LQHENKSLIISLIKPMMSVFIDLTEDIILGGPPPVLRFEVRHSDKLITYILRNKFTLGRQQQPDFVGASLNS
jgi:hypothetical protein